MKRWLVIFAAGLPGLMGSVAGAQTSAPTAQVVKGPDERFKADILVVVAHPDDEGGATPYLARAIYDEHKRVAVVFATRGGSGGNDYSREHGPALADIREQEARQACAKLGITNVWFLDGKDTASQNVLNSLANWGHGANLEALVRIVRITRPEVIISWLPGIFIGENHGDHQASGVLATQAFDLANDPTAFPAQVAGASKRLEIYLENLTPWQPKKLYFFSDADDQKQFAGSGPAYSIKEISPSQKKPYWRLAMDAAMPHLTQFPEDIQHFSKMSDEELNKMMSDPNAGWWPEPMTLIFGKAKGPVDRTAEVFSKKDVIYDVANPPMEPDESLENNFRLRLGGAWEFYRRFYAAHGLWPSTPEEPEIAIKQGETLLIPLSIDRSKSLSREIQITVSAPKGWTVTGGQGKFALPDEPLCSLEVTIQSPAEKTDSSQKAQTVVVTAESGGKQAGRVALSVKLKRNALPQ